MQKKKKKLKTIVFTYFLAVLLIFCACLGGMTMAVSQWIVQANAAAHYRDTTRYVGENIARELNDMEGICNYLFLNADVKTILGNYAQQNYAYVHAMDGLDALLRQNVMSNVFSSLNTVVLFDAGQVAYRYFQNPAQGWRRTFSARDLYGSGPFSRAVAENRMVLSAHDYLGDGTKGVSVFRAVMDEHYSRVIGGMLLCFDLELINDALLSRVGGTGFSTFLVDERGALLGGAGDAPPQYAIDRLPGFGEEDVVVRRERGLDEMTLYYPIGRQRCYVVCLLSVKNLLAQSWLLAPMILFALVFGALASLFVWYFMNRRVVKPIQAIRDSLNRAKAGEHLPIVRPDGHGSGIAEIEALVDSYNQNVRRIDELADKLSEEKTSYKDLEYKALQSQINSHFITNTLNAVRWLAIIQNANNIKELVDAFSRLLKSTWQGLNNDSTIEKELANVKDYIFIQQITHSYNTEIFYEVDDSLLGERCMKFILQPLVENAFFHGIAPKEGVGTIRVSVRLARRGGREALRAVVEDDGVGMDEGTARDALHHKDRDSRFNGIGIGNIHERLQLKYGPEYGVSIESEPGRYTRMTVWLPRLEREREDG